MEANTQGSSTHRLIIDRKKNDLKWLESSFEVASGEEEALSLEDKVSGKLASEGESAEEEENIEELVSEGESSLAKDDEDKHISDTDIALFDTIARATTGQKRSLKKQKALDNLYCVQWVNIVEKNPVPVHIYKIGRGQEGREKQVHGTNPVHFPLIRKWNGAGYVEAKMHNLLNAYHFYHNAGQEWFDLEHAKDNIGLFLDNCYLNAVRGEV